MEATRRFSSEMNIGRGTELDVQVRPSADTAAPDDAASDLALVRLAQDDPRAFAPLYERYAPIVYHYCLRRLSHREAAADATAITFTKAIGALSRFRPDPRRDGSTFRSWLFTIAHNVIIDQRRRHRTHTSLDADDQHLAATLVEPGPTPEDHAIRNDDARRVRSLLAQLPERHRAIVELRLAGLSGAEIAATLGMTESAVKSAQFRAYGTLRTMLEQDHSTTSQERYQ
jgi:RNA polymerase sigma-70 factor (ECF subfamily)